MNTHQCYLQPTELPAPSDKYIFFDIEAMQEAGIHKANLVVAQYMNGEQYDFHTLETFCEWLIHRRHKHYTVLAHYGKDTTFNSL